MGKHTHQTSKYSNNVFVKVWMILNVFLGIGSGSFFSYEASKSCGGVYTLSLICCFSFVFINLFLLGFTQLWKKWIHLFNIVLFLTISSVAFLTVYEVYKQTICESQWCISQGVDSGSFLQQFKTQEDLKGLINGFCQQDLKAQKIEIRIAASAQYRVLLKDQDLWSIENSAPFALSASVGSISILFSFLLLIDTIRQFKYKPKSSILV